MSQHRLWQLGVLLIILTAVAVYLGLYYGWIDAQAVVSILGAVGAGFLTIVAKLPTRQPTVSPPTIDDRIRALRSNLAASSHLINEINAEFEPELYHCSVIIAFLSL